MSAHGEFAYSAKQREIMRLLGEAIDRGEEMDTEDLHQSLSYECSRQALLCSLKVLKKHDMVATEPRRRRRMLVTLTARGFNLYRSG